MIGLALTQEAKLHQVHAAIAMLTGSQARQFTIACAERALPLFEAGKTCKGDRSPRDAIAIARRMIAGTVSDRERQDAALRVLATIDRLQLMITAQSPDLDPVADLEYDLVGRIIAAQIAMDAVYPDARAGAMSAADWTMHAAQWAAARGHGAWDGIVDWMLLEAACCAILGPGPLPYQWNRA